MSTTFKCKRVTVDHFRLNFLFIQSSYRCTVSRPHSEDVWTYVIITLSVLFLVSLAICCVGFCLWYRTSEDLQVRFAGTALTNLYNCATGKGALALVLPAGCRPAASCCSQGLLVDERNAPSTADDVHSAGAQVATTHHPLPVGTFWRWSNSAQKVQLGLRLQRSQLGFL